MGCITGGLVEAVVPYIDAIDSQEANYDTVVDRAKKTMV
jgi:hypothetical protein